MDPFALGLIKAAAIIEDGRIEKFVEEKYSSFKSGIGAKIVADETTLKELASHAEKLGAPENPGSGRIEYLESIVNSILFR
jgi:xylose isomerase